MIDAVKKKPQRIRMQADFRYRAAAQPSMDIAKVLSLGGDWKAEDLYEGKVVPKKARQLITVPDDMWIRQQRITFSSVAELKAKAYEGSAAEHGNVRKPCRTDY